MIIDIQPRSELVKKHVASFNMFEKRKDFRLNFFAFPQLGSTMEFYENAGITRSINELKVIPLKSSTKEKDKCSIEILGRYTEPIFISYDGYVNGFTINFTPLGINYFFNESYKQLASGNF